MKQSQDHSFSRSMENESNQLRISILPAPAQGHMIPMIDIAKAFAIRGAKITIITSPAFAAIFLKQIERANQLGLEFHVQTVKFPSTEVGMPDDWENTDAVAYNQNLPKFAVALSLLRELVLHILEKRRPDCLVTYFYFAWATDIAARLKIPRLAFGDVITRHQPQKGVSCDSETFLMPHLPGDIGAFGWAFRKPIQAPKPFHPKLTRNQLPPHSRQEVGTDLSKLQREAFESEAKGFGTNFNSFYELEKDYANYYKNVLGRNVKMNKKNEH
ncbi:hypothetical protein EUGRSUZ_I01119 [Eucalyptus grandis]|uniref:Uncharacterized protein n=2 Tax=Eucalyptus grandis TaxID=71139 RepID=A0A059AMT5_EUCGR|nr:hypothetical protein EUGRSUZ_I01119 [Eucalyptus grandis]